MEPIAKNLCFFLLTENEIFIFRILHAKIQEKERNPAWEKTFHSNHLQNLII